MVPQANTVPSYSELLQEAGKQVRSRKSILFWRTLLLVWPALVFVGFFLWGNGFSGKDLAERISSGENFEGVIFYILFVVIGFLAVVYYFVINFIFTVEKRIWIDSFFDQRNLTSGESWRIARRLFFPAFRLWWGIFWRYYFLLIFFYLVFITALIYYMVSSEENLAAQYGLSFFLVGFIMFLILLYIIQLRLRFVWFLFLDTYTPTSFSVRALLEEMRKLNTISKGEAFRKALIAHLGSDMLRVITQNMVRSLQAGFGLLGHTGRVFGAFFRVFGEEYGKQAVDLGKIAALYILYRHARELLYGASQGVNENVYRLARKEGYV